MNGFAVRHYDNWTETLLRAAKETPSGQGRSGICDAAYAPQWAHGEMSRGKRAKVGREKSLCVHGNAQITLRCEHEAKAQYSKLHGI
jgi:hypothetical protein